MGFYSAKKDIYNIGIVDNDQQTLTSVAASSTTTLNSQSGTGVFYWAIFNCVAKADCHLLKPNVRLDGNDLLAGWGFQYWNNILVADGKPTAPVRLIEYNNDGICTLEVFYPQGLPFNTSVALVVTNGIADTYQMTWQTVHTLLT